MLSATGQARLYPESKRQETEATTTLTAAVSDVGIAEGDTLCSVLVQQK